jgi:preprotein translocase subunit Sss1
MGVAVSLIIAAVGLVLALAVHPASEGSIDVNTVGWILFLVGLIGFVIDLLLWSSWGPGYMRNNSATVVERRVPMYPRRRRRVVEEIDDPAGPPPGY